MSRPFADAVVDDLVQLRPDLGPIAVTDRVQQQVAQRLPLERLAEHVEDLAAVGASRCSSILSSSSWNTVAFPGAGRDQVPQVADLGLADAVDAAEPLLDPVRVPRQVVVDHQVGALQVQALARGVGGDQHPAVRVLGEQLHAPCGAPRAGHRRGW